MGKVRMCAKCGVEPASSARHHYCDACRPPRKAGGKLAKTDERGYGSSHVRERKRWGRVVKAGNANCSRCGGPIDPNEEWHLDHTDDRLGYLGPAHARCNVAAAAQNRRPARRTRSRDW